MWRVVLLAFCYHVVSQAQPATDEPSTRHTRELIECCPCPKGSDMLVSQSRMADECPCRSRSADSEGASSMLSQKSEPGRRFNSVPFMRSNNPKDEVKNLLEPEVGLAASMLETLREATEEEYQDALARDAARDAVPEESRNVVIIVKPRNNDDIVSEASNVKQNRCIHPLGRARTVSQPFRTLPNILDHAKPRKQSVMNLWDRDSNVGASNVQESIVDKNGGDGPRSLFRFGTPLRDALKSSSMILNPTVLDTLKSRPNLFERLNLPLIPKMKMDTPLRKANNIYTDSPPSNIVQKKVEKVPKGIILPKFSNRPHILKNNLNLGDVEIIQEVTPKLPLLKSKLFNNDLSSNRDTHEDSDSTYDSEMNEKVLLPQIIPEKENLNERTDRRESLLNNIQLNEENIEDAFTSPSESVPTIVSVPQTVMSNKPDCNDLSSEEIIATTTESLSMDLQEDSESSESLDPTQLSEIEDVTNNEAEKISHETIDEANEESDMSTEKIENVFPFNGIDRKETILPSESNQDKDEPIDKVNDEALSDDDFSEAHTKSLIPSLSKKDDIISKTKSAPPITDKLSTIRDNVRKTLQNLKKNSLNSGPVQEEKIKSAAPTHILDQAPKTEETSKEVDTSAKDRKKELEQVTFKDLQKLSDDLLVLSSNNEESSTPKEEEKVQRVAEQSNQNPDSGSGSTYNTDSDLQEEATSDSDVGVPNNANAELSKDKPCLLSDDAKIKQPQQTKSAVQDVHLNDMSSEASAPSPGILPALLDPLNLSDHKRPSLFQNLNTLDPLNLNKKLGSLQLDPLNIGEKLRSPILPDSDPLNLNDKLVSPLLPILDPLNVGSALQDIIATPTIQDDQLNLLANPINEILKLPTLEDLREGLASVFDTDKKSAEHNLSDEDGDCTDDIHEMASAASNDKFRVPSIKPSEDLNVDIFQLNPLSSSQKDILSKLPRLNLNNFRTKLPIPTNLELKPVKLESRIGNDKGNILGASLTFGDKAAPRKGIPQLNLLGQPLGNLPNFDELRNALHSGAHNLLDSSKPNLDLFRNSHYRSSGFPDIEEIRRNAEKTFKSLQKRMRSGLNVPGSILNNPLNDKLANPQDLLEDVNDKLKAIHYDLNDRLSLIHEDFLDKSRLKPLSIPAHTPNLTTGRSSNHKELNTFRKIKAKPSRLQTSTRTVSSQETDPFDSKNDNSILRSPSRKNLKRLHIDPQKGLVGAESSLIPTKVEPPITKSTIHFPKKIPVTPLSQRLPTLRQGSDLKGKPLSLLKRPNLKDLKTPVLRKPSPFKDTMSKVTITFATTTTAPVTAPLESYGTAPSIKITKPNVQKSNDELLKSSSITRPKTLSETKRLPSESTPSRISSPVKSKNNFKSTNTHKDFPHLQNTDPIESTKPRIFSHKGLRDAQLGFNENNNDRLKLSKIKNNEPEIKSVEPEIKPLPWPKSDEDSFLAKVREAIQARLASFDTKKAPKANIEKVDTKNMGNTNVDMLKSASENNDVQGEAPLKESVPYKCRMTCTRD